MRKGNAANLTNAGKGRPKGSKNKLGVSAKEAIAIAADRLGGPNRLSDWAQESPDNERVFWGTIYPRLIPHEVTGADGGALQVHIVRFDADSNAAE